MECWDLAHESIPAEEMIQLTRPDRGIVNGKIAYSLVMNCYISNGTDGV